MKIYIPRKVTLNINNIKIKITYLQLKYPSHTNIRINKFNNKRTLVIETALNCN